MPLDKRVRVFDADDKGKKIGETAETPDWVDAISLSPDGRFLATAGADGRAMVWLSDRVNNRPVSELLGHEGAVTDVQFHPSAPWRLATAGVDGTARIWQLPERTVLTGSGGWMFAGEVSQYGGHLVTAEDKGVLRVYDSTPGGGINRQWSMAIMTPTSTHRRECCSAPRSVPTPQRSWRPADLVSRLGYGSGSGAMRFTALDPAEDSSAHPRSSVPTAAGLLPATGRAGSSFGT